MKQKTSADRKRMGAFACLVGIITILGAINSGVGQVLYQVRYAGIAVSIVMIGIGLYQIFRRDP